MKRRSIRWQLPMSYAAIACLTALSLGIVLLTVLREYYAGQEQAYLESSARAISRILIENLDNDIPPERLQSQIQALSFFSETRIKYLDSQNQLIADSGQMRQYVFGFSQASPNVIAFEADAPELARLQAVERSSPWFWSVGADGTAGTLQPDTSDQPPIQDAVDVFSIGPAEETDRLVFAPGTSVREGDTLFEVRLSPDAIPAGTVAVLPMRSAFFDPRPNGQPGIYRTTTRSDQSASLHLISHRDGTPMGTVIVSEGPAYGEQIVNSVARGGLVAGGFAVFLAGFAGWLVSRRITEPLVTLTDATTRMSQGDLSVRTDINRRDELGMLASSFNEMAGRIENTVVALRRFVADAAHELHTPLTALRTNLELAAEHGQSPAHERALQQMQRIQSLADDLLDLSRIEAQSEPTDPAAVNMTAVVQECSAVYASRAEQLDINFELNTPVSAFFVTGNNSQLQRLVSNLLDNAIKFTPPDGQIRVTLQTDETSHLTLIIQDTGIGIPQEDMAYLFERFRRGRNTASYPGSGLGLAIVKAIVDAHRGTVAAESGPQGTTIRVRLPLMLK